MQIHEVQPNTKNKKKKRVGRGGKRGTYSGKGMKGQKSRAGAKMQPIIRESLKRYPKLRGYNFSPLKNVFTVNIATLDKNFSDGAVINPKAIAARGIIGKGKRLEIKVLGTGETEKKFYVQGCMISKSAKETIEKAGGEVKEEKKKDKKKEVKEEKKKDKKKEVKEEKKKDKKKEVKEEEKEDKKKEVKNKQEIKEEGEEKAKK